MTIMRQYPYQRTAFFIFVVLLTSQIIHAQTRVIAPEGGHAQIDTQLANETLQALVHGSSITQRKVMAEIQKNPENYAPPVFYALSNVLFSKGKKDDAAFWFYAGQLRARADANICADESARQAVAALNHQYGSAINQHMFKNIAQLKKLIPKVIEWERNTAYNYDRRWINLHGMDAVLGGDRPLSLPQEQWEAIDEQTRANYLQGFQQAMKEMENR